MLRRRRSGMHAREDPERDHRAPHPFRSSHPNPHRQEDTRTPVLHGSRVAVLPRPEPAGAFQVIVLHANALGRRAHVQFPANRVSRPVRVLRTPAPAPGAGPGPDVCEGLREFSGLSRTKPFGRCRRVWTHAETSFMFRGRSTLHLRSRSRSSPDVIDSGAISSRPRR
jgi:hypothetical protein